MKLDLQPKVSVVIPLYNAEAYIEDCLQSVLAQTLQDIEVLVVDDKGTDHSVQRVQQLAANHPRGHQIRLIEMPQNSRAGMARNAGIEQAQGDYIAFVDSDDRIAPDMLERLYQLAEANGSDVSMCDALKVFPDGTSLVMKHPNLSYGRIDEKTRCSLLTAYTTAMWTMLCRRSFLNDNAIRFSREKYEDSYFVPQVFLFAKILSYEQAPLYHYIVREASICTTIDDTKYQQKVELFDKLFLLLKEKSVYESYREELEFVYIKKGYLTPLFNYVLNSTSPKKATISSIRRHAEEQLPLMRKNCYYRRSMKVRLSETLFRLFPLLAVRLLKRHSKKTRDLF